MDDFSILNSMIAINEEKGIAKAARRLFMTQSALNQQLLKLEKELGTPLFKREYHLMVPTYAGQIYLNMARSVIEERDKAYKKIHDVEKREIGEISIVFSPEKGAQAFTEVYPVFHEHYPGYTFKTQETNVPAMTNLLLQHKVTFAFMLYSDLIPLNPLFDHFDQTSEYLILALPKTHPLAPLAGDESWRTLPSLDIKRLKNDSFILCSQNTIARRYVDRLLQENEMTIKVLFESSNNSTILKMVCRNMGPAFLPESYIDPSLPVVYFRTTPPMIWIQTAAYLKGTYISKPEQDFLNMMRNQARFSQTQRER